MKIAAKAAEIGLYFFDESGFSTLPEVQRSWSPIRCPHRTDASEYKARLNVIGALDFGSNRLIFDSKAGSVREEDVIRFLDNLAAQCPKDRPNFCVMDNASIHRYIDQSHRDRWLAQGLVLYFIPPYSPELNLIEIVWKHAKYFWRGFTTWQRSELKEAVHGLLDGFGLKFNICFR